MPVLDTTEYVLRLARAKKSRPALRFSKGRNEVVTILANAL
jgi:hypothetical protein